MQADPSYGTVDVGDTGALGGSVSFAASPAPARVFARLFLSISARIWRACRSGVFILGVVAKMNLQ